MTQCQQQLQREGKPSPRTCTICGLGPCHYPKPAKAAFKPLVIGLDFDGTCVTHEFPKVGREIGAVPVLKELVEAGHKLILWTMRSDGRDQLTARNGQPLENPNPLTDAVKWFEGHGIPLYGIQRNPTQDAWTSSPKAYCNIYIDDAALGAPLIHPEDGGKPYIDWGAVREIFFS